MKRGLDNRAEDKSGQIREKNGASLIKNLTLTFPELKVFNQKKTLTQIKKQTGAESLDQVRKIARKEQRSK